MAFFEVEFPTAVSFGAMGGGTFNTSVTEGFSGYEQRNRNWQNPLGKWEIALANKSKSYFDIAHAFYLVIGGQADAFRFKDHKDFQATAELLGVGDGATTAFQLVKHYTVSNRTFVRTIKKPITSQAKDCYGNALPDTVTVYVDGAKQAAGVTIDSTTGIVTFAAAPAVGAVITADFQFHFPVRFASDEALKTAAVLESNIAGGAMLVTWGSISLQEVRV